VRKLIISLFLLYEVCGINTKKKEKRMKKKIFFPVFILFVFYLVSLSLAQDDLIVQADEICSGMKDLAAAEKALEMYRKALGEAENKFDPYWKIARVHYYIGKHTKSKKDKKIIFSQGIYYGDKAIALESERPEGWYWRAVNQGVYGEAKGVLKSLSLVKPIKKAMNKVIEIDRSFEDGGADRVLGRVFFKVPGIAGGSKKKSLEHLLKSKELGPEDPLTRVYLADTYLALKEVDKAKEELNYVLSMESDPRWMSGMDEVKEEAKVLLKHKKFRKKK
jgi:tetratricopeptide (TPR) repeat protein